MILVQTLFRRISVIATALILMILSACEYDEIKRYNMGNDFLDDPTQVFMIDTLTVRTSTIKHDSVATSQQNRVMAGLLRDHMDVETYAEAYFRLQAPSIPTFHESARFDSTHFILYFDGYWHGDTSKVATFELYQLSEDITYDENNYYIYSNKRFAHNTEPLATFSVDLAQNRDSVVVALPADFSKQMYDQVYNKLDVVTEPDSFKTVYKGFVIKPVEANPAFVMGFKVNADSTQKPKIVVHYSDNRVNADFTNNSYRIEYPLLYTQSKSVSSTETVNYFVSTYLENRYQGSIFSEILPGEFILPSASTNNITMVQAGINVRTRIEIPYIDNLYHLGLGSIMKAELQFEPVYSSYDEFYQLPASLEMFLIDGRNRQMGSSPLPLINPEERAYAILYKNPVFANQAIYTFDITRFIKDEYDSKALSDYALALSFPSSSISTQSVFMSNLIYNSVNRLYIGNQQNRDHKMKLKIYMSIN